MKHSLEWHEYTIFCKEASLLKLEKEFIELRNKITQSKHELGHYLVQYRRAVNEGLSEFDRDTFEPIKGNLK